MSEHKLIWTLERNNQSIEDWLNLEIIQKGWIIINNKQFLEDPTYLILTGDLSFKYYSSFTIKKKKLIK